MYRSLLLLSFVSLFGHNGFTQGSTDVTSAEYAFAKLAREQTMKQAFVQYMDSAAVVFQGGKIFNAVSFWNKQPETQGKLLWQPSFHGISASGDLGFTTGPFEYRLRLEDSVLGAGHYTTVWTKTKNGQWKFLVDLGVEYATSLFASQSLQSFTAFTPSGADDDIMKIEQQFIMNLQQGGGNTYRNYVMKKSWFNTDGRHPLQNVDRILEEATALPGDMRFSPVAGGMASSKDLAYVYGAVSYGEKKENYLRIWAHTAEGWKILVQVLKK